MVKLIKSVERAMDKSLSILLVDDHVLFRSGLKFLLEELDSDIQFLEAESCEAALSYGTDQPIDLILLDYHLPDSGEGFEALQKIKHQFEQATIVVLSSEDNPEIIRGAVESGAAGFIPKSSTPDIMIATLKLILAGGIYLPPTAMAQTSKIPDKKVTSSSESTEMDTLKSQLSDRQFEVLIGAIKGKPNKIIARELNIAEGTVKAHLSVAYRILDVKNRTEAVFKAAKLGFSQEYQA